MKRFWSTSLYGDPPGYAGPGVGFPEVYLASEVDAALAEKDAEIARLKEEIAGWESIAKTHNGYKP